MDRLVVNNVENVRWALLQNMNDSFVRHAGALDRRLAQTVKDIERAIDEACERRQDGASAVDERLSMLDEWLREVDGLMEEAARMG